jgi:hypothetical protein
MTNHVPFVRNSFPEVPMMYFARVQNNKPLTIGSRTLQKVSTKAPSRLELTSFFRTHLFNESKEECSWLPIHKSKKKMVLFRHWYQYDNFLKSEEKKTFITQFKQNDSRKNTRTMFNVLCSFYSFEPEKDDFYFKPENLELLYKLNVFIGFWFNIALQHPKIMLKNIDE